ncbi:flagellin [Curvivirga sp.]|uniref:flagellin n=1 Tax=Curvivirga sp. TaxID=2856848 RepID=UPI003B595425
MTRVATFSNYQNLLNMSMNVQSDVSSKQLDIASGKISENYYDLASSTNLILDLEHSMSTSEQYIDNAEQVSAQVEATYAALNSMVDVMANFTSSVTASLGGTDDVEELNATAQASLEEMGALLNQQYGDIYLFGGTDTGQAPVDVSSASYTAQTYPSTVSTDYYSGNDETRSFHADDNYEINYGVTANESAFEKAIRAMSMMANMDPHDEDAIAEAHDLMNEATAEIAALQAEVSVTASNIENTIDAHTNAQLITESMLGDLTEVDVAEATAELNQLQAQLEASFSAISNATSLNLIDYL